MDETSLVEACLLLRLVSMVEACLLLRLVYC